ncbi:MAG TPA: L-histidine N(alpha)-methyltransferase [Pyrinomonadaceae bacterium]|jgi:L-histidine Nalpha-methyltransferase|nr:L-histidine N(alpha)-methyltransferase [Pyrinomonadaceae bacterium]
MSQPHPQISSPRFVVHDLTKQNGHANFARDVRAGLSSSPKQLFPKYLYDQLGSRLFEAICEVPEYYLTRAEHEILSTHGDDIVGAIPDCDTLIELGSGSAEKTRQLIEALIRRHGELLFVPIDISASALKQSSESLLGSYPELRIRAYAADYFQALEALPSLGSRPVLVLFLGSNIGNFEPDEALNFLSAIRRVLRPNDALLLGADLKKDRTALEAAYNDPLGVTRAFIVNELERINRELGANFDLWAFGLRSFYNESRGRVEVYLESLRSQAVEIRDLELSLGFAAGERIHVENAYKFDLSDLNRLAAETGFSLARTWLDKENRFSSNLLFAADV